MARTKSELLSSMGSGFEILKAITDEVISQGGTDDDVRRILKDKKVRKQIAGMLVSNTDEVLSVTINRVRTIANGIKAGKYDWSNLHINDKNFPGTGKGYEETEIILVHFDKSMSTDQVLKELDKRDLRPADLQELLSLGEQYPDKQREFPIIALGSVWRIPDGSRCASCLGGNDSVRGLSLFWIGLGWVGIWRFAAARK